MGRPKSTPVVPKFSDEPPARSPEDRENQLIALAYDAVEERIRSGTASSQEYVHFLRMGSARERREQEKLKNENLKLEAQIGAIESAKNVEALYKDAISAMRTYTGQDHITE